MNIYEKLIEVRKEVPYLQKGVYNKGQQYSYVSSSQALGAVRAKIDELGLLLIPSVIDAKFSELCKGISEKGKETVTIITELTIEYTWLNAENPEEKFSITWYGQGIDIGGEKGVGKALTYAEKYFMLKFFNIATDKDDPDAFQDKIEGKEQPKEQHPTEKVFGSKPAPKNKVCEVCGLAISDKVAEFSNSKYGKELCYNCQKEAI